MCARLILGASLGLWLLIAAAYAQTATPQEVERVQNIKIGVMQRNLDDAYLAVARTQEALGAAQKKAGELEAYWKAYIAGPAKAEHWLHPSAEPTGPTSAPTMPAVTPKP
jgi:hypothetical protein